MLANARFDARWAKSSTGFARPTSPSEAWDGVKDKSADLADGAMQAVKKRPARFRWRSALSPCSWPASR